MTDNTAKELREQLAKEHWDWLSRIVKYVPVTNRDDAFIQYIFTLAFTHGGKHEAEK